MSGFASKPRALSCYLCGAQFGSSSLLIHVKSCQKKWVSQQEQQPKDKRRPLPPLPEELADQKDPSKLAASTEKASLPLTSAEIDAFNTRMFSVFDRASLNVCKHCSRSFSDEAFVRHSKVCSAEKPFKPIKVDSSGDSGKAQVNLSATAPAGSLGSPKSPASPGPRSFTCYLCGQSFMSRSLGIHLPQCLVKWKAEEARRPAGQQREPPCPPPELADPSDSSKLRSFKDGVAEGILPSLPSEVEAFNARMSAIHSESTLARCDNCGRTFNWESLERHRKGCSPSSPSKGAGGGAGSKGLGKTPPRIGSASGGSPQKQEGGDQGAPQSPSSGGPKTYTCYLCGRGFMSRSLGIHLPQCLERWYAEEAQRPVKDHRPAPLPPKELADPLDPGKIRSFKHGVEEGILPARKRDVDAFNKKMTSYWDQASLSSCPNCGRTFGWEALERHKVLCTPESPMKGVGGQGGIKKPDGSSSTASKDMSVMSPTRPKNLTPSGSMKMGPKVYTCFLCGRGFMNQSLGIHLPKCLQKWEAEEQLRHPDVQRLPPLPPPELADDQDPEQLLSFKDGIVEGVLPKDQHGIDDFNRRMQEHYERYSLVRCPNCERTFQWEALAKHEKVCTPEKPMKAVSGLRGPGSK